MKGQLFDHEVGKRVYERVKGIFSLVFQIVQHGFH